MEPQILSDMTCTVEVGLIRGLLFGVPEGGCIALGPASLIVPLLAFALGVAGLQWVVRRLLFGRPDERGAGGPDGPVWSVREEGNRRRAARIRN